MQGETPRKIGRSVKTLNHQTDQAENGVMTLPQCANADGQLPSCAPLANPYVPFQQTGADLYTASCALIRGTLFPGSIFPMAGRKTRRRSLQLPLWSFSRWALRCRSWHCISTRTRRTPRPRSFLTSTSSSTMQAIEQYQQGNGPLTLMDAAANGTYDWLAGPWPWEYRKER